MAGHIALGALQPELPVKSCDELLQGRLRSGAQDRRYQISPFDFTVMAGVAHLGEMRLSGFLLAGTKDRSSFARPGATFNFREVLRGCGFRAAAVTAAALCAHAAAASDCRDCFTALARFGFYKEMIGRGAKVSLRFSTRCQLELPYVRKKPERIQLIERWPGTCSRESWTV